METLEMPTLKDSTVYAREQTVWLKHQIEFCNRWMTSKDEHYPHVFSYLQHMLEHLTDALAAINSGMACRPWRAKYDYAMANYEMDKQGFLLIAESAL